jgi:hypothetical protein
MDDVFLGHLVLGVILMGLSTWWSFVTSYRVIQATYTDERKQASTLCYEASVSMPLFFLPWKNLQLAPIESYIKLMLVCLILGFTYTSNLQHPQNMAINLSHGTMYFTFGFASFVEVLVHRGDRLLRKVDFVLSALSFAFLAFLLALHKDDMRPVIIHVHRLLGMSALICAIFILLEASFQNQHLFTYGRIVFVFLQGSWITLAGKMASPEQRLFDLDSAELPMFVNVYFSWNIILILIALVAEYFLLKWIYLNGSGRVKSILDHLH